MGLIPGEGNGNPIWYDCPGNAMDKGPAGRQSMGSQRAGCAYVTKTTTTKYFLRWTKAEGVYWH